MAEGSKTCCSQARVIWLGHLYVGFSLILGLAWIRGTAPVARVQGWLRNAATQRQLQGFVSGGVCSTLEVWHWGWAPLNVLSDLGPGFTNPKIHKRRWGPAPLRANVVSDNRGDPAFALLLHMEALRLGKG